MGSDFWTVAARFFRSPACKFVLLSALGLVLVIPLLVVWGLVEERRNRAGGVSAEIADLWGGLQSVSGPFLVVPYTVRTTTTVDGKAVESLSLQNAVILPERLEVRGNAKTEVLHRSIYEVTVYRAELQLSGRFAPSDLSAFTGDVVAVRWSEAVLALLISDVSGLESATPVTIDGGGEVTFEPSVGVPSQTASGIHAAIGRKSTVLRGAATPAAAGAPGFAFSTGIVFKGSSELSLWPVARETVVKLESPWQHPSFVGAFLPGERRVDASGFVASWSVPNLARSVPESWSLAEAGFERLMPYQFGVRFYVPVDFYNLAERSLKYGLLFIAMAFMVVFLMEVLSGRKVHPIQYLFVGTAMVFFYILLISLAEHIGFAPAYMTAAAATGGMLSLYVGSTLASRAKGLIMLATFLVLFGLLYFVLTLEDYALLMGAIAGFMMLTATMFLTLRVDWSGAGRPS